RRLDQSVRKPSRTVDLNRDGLAADALAARLSTHPSIGQRPGALQTSQEKIGSHGGTSFSDRFMAFGHWTDDGWKTGFGLLGEHLLRRGQRKQSPCTKSRQL